MSVAHSAPTAPRSSVALLADRDFGGLFWGKTIAVIGVWAYAVAAAVSVFDATGSTIAVGLVGAAQFIPQVLFAPLTGAWADRNDPRKQLVLGRILCLTGAGGLAVWVQLLQPEEWAFAIAVLIGSLVVGIGFVIGGPAMQSVVPRMVTREELPAAMALNTAPMTAARVAGPLLGAAFVAATGPAAGFAFAAVGQLVFLGLLYIVRIPGATHTADDGTDYSVRAAWRHVLDDRPLLLLLVGVTAVTFGAEPSITLAPALAQTLGSGTWLVGALTASFGVGAAIGLMLVGTLRRGGRANRPITVGLAFLTIGMATAMVGPAMVPAIAGFGLAGVGFTLAFTSLSTAVMMRVPEYLRGRIIAFYMICFVGFRPLAALVVGAVADLSSVQLGIAVPVLVTAVVTAIFWLRSPADQPYRPPPTTTSNAATEVRGPHPARAS